MDFAHLHVASAYSLRYGASMPDALVARAAEHGQRVLALTDRDGVYGAVRFVRACAAVGIAPVLGVDLALDLPHVLPPDEGVRHPPGRRSCHAPCTRRSSTSLARGKGS